MRISRSTGAFSGLALILLGLWGGVIPFIGPYFSYAFGPYGSWHYSAERLWLDILPALAVVLGGAALLWSGHRLSGVLSGWLAVAGGAWFVGGTAVSRVWDHTTWPIGIPTGGSTRQMLEQLGYFYGLGALIIALAAFALGRFVSRPSLVIEPAAEPAGEPVTATSAAADASAPSPTPADAAAVTDDPAATPATTTSR